MKKYVVETWKAGIVWKENRMDNPLSEIFFGGKQMQSG
jgi:hypothetical protein